MRGGGEAGEGWGRFQEVLRLFDRLSTNETMRREGGFQTRRYSDLPDGVDTESFIEGWGRGG